MIHVCNRIINSVGVKIMRVERKCSGGGFAGWGWWWWWWWWGGMWGGGYVGVGGGLETAVDVGA